MADKKSSGKGIERRKSERVDFLTSISVDIEAGENIININGDSKDLSLKGIFVYTDEKVQKGSLCRVKIFLLRARDNVELNIRGRVARIENNGLGIIFDSIDVDSFSHLKNIVKYNS